MVNSEVAGQNKGPQMAINGFIAWLLIISLTTVYLLWAIVPDSILHSLHITYYPDRYWAVAVPAILIMIFFYYYATSMCMILITTHPLDDGRCITDVDSKEERQITPGALTQNGGSVPPLVNIPVSISSRLLFLPWKSKLEQ